jgi:hypothetical protein
LYLFVEYLWYVDLQGEQNKINPRISRKGRADGLAIQHRRRDGGLLTNVAVRGSSLLLILNGSNAQFNTLVLLLGRGQIRRM